MKSHYLEERERAITTLCNTVSRIRSILDLEADRNCHFDAESAALTQAYVPAQLALLQLMKEESEENDNE